MNLNDKIEEYTTGLNQRGLLRIREISESCDPFLVRFDSNDYLSLANDKDIMQAYQHGYRDYPIGSGASMLLSGYHANHQALEKAFAKLLEVDDCLLFSSGYAANLAVTALLGSLKVHCLIDRNSHASIYDGLAQSRVHYSRYHHNNVDDLSQKLEKVGEDSAVITEGIFSMSGQMAPLEILSSLCFSHKVALLVDEAHSFGVLGSQGKGAVNYHGLTQKEVPLRMIPLGKAFAAQGAIVAGQGKWIHALLQAARSLIYSTASSPALSYGLLKTLEIVVASDDKRHWLMQLVRFFREQIKNSPLRWSDSETPIQQLQLGCPHLAFHYAHELKKEGICCSVIRAPTVNAKSTGLRIILNYQHRQEQIQNLFEKLHAIYEPTQ